MDVPTPDRLGIKKLNRKTIALHKFIDFHAPRGLGVEKTGWKREIEGNEGETGC